MVKRSVPQEECLYCHGIPSLPGPCPGCGEPKAPEETRQAGDGRAVPAFLPQGNYFSRFSSHHPHV